MKKIILLLLTATAFSMHIEAQPVAKFDAMSHNLGTVLWNALQTTEFTITNSGNRPLIINDVAVSCGCTAVKWDKSPIAAGKTGTIVVSYNAEALGTFNKQVAVYTNAGKRPEYLSIKGKVVATKPEYTGDYKYSIGDIKLNAIDLEFDDINRGDVPQKTIEIYNNGAELYKPELMHLPKYLSVEAIPESILPNHGGKLIVTLDSKELRNMGLTQTSVYLSRYPGDKVGEDNEIGVSAVLLPSFAKQTEAQLAYSPKIKLSAESLDLGNIREKDKLKGAITISNEGKSTLLIRSVQVFNTALNVGVSRKIAPGRHTKLKISVLRKYLKRSRNRLSVLMITNDPQRPKVIIDVKAAR